VTMPITAVAGGNSQQVPAIVVEDVNHHTPDPVTPPVVEAVPEPPTPQDGGIAELRDIVATLATSVTNLTETVAGLASGKIGRDESPAKGPWTHLGHAMHSNDES
jgi:hypothetical protein